MMDKIRLAVAGALSWLASKVAPTSMSGVFLAYNKMLDNFPKELASGRTYGVVMAPWCIEESNADRADDMLSDCLIAAARARESHEATA